MSQPEYDGFLAGLLDSMAEGNWQFDITLNVGGLVISGTPIGEKDYFIGLGNVFDEGIQKHSTEVGTGPWVNVQEGAELADAAFRERLARRQEIQKQDTSTVGEKRRIAEELDQEARTFVYLRVIVQRG